MALFSIEDLDPSQASPSTPPVRLFGPEDLDPPTPQSQTPRAQLFSIDDLDDEPSVPGRLEPGNIDLFNRPRVANPDGTISTVRTISINDDGREILIPTVVGDRVVADDEAVDEYVRTGRHLGAFDTPDSATRYAQQLHDEYAAGQYDRPREPDFRVDVVGQMPRESTPAPVAGRGTSLNLSAAPYEKAENVGRAFGAGGVRFNVGFWGVLQAAADVLGLESVSDWARGAGEQATGIAESVRGPQEGAGPTEKAIYSGVESMGLSVPALALGMATGSPAATLGVMGGATGGESYSQAREQGIGVPQALAHATSQAAIEVATEKIPASRLLGDVARRSGFMQTIMRQVASEVPGEQVATALQDLNDWATFNPDAPFADYLKERPSAAAQTLVATLVASVGQTAGAIAVDRAAGAERAKAPAPPVAAPESQAIPPVEAPVAPPIEPAPAESLPVEPSERVSGAEPVLYGPTDLDGPAQGEPISADGTPLRVPQGPHVFSPADLDQPAETTPTVPDSVLSAFPDLAPADSGLIPIHQFTADEQAALRAAGFVESGVTSTGQAHDGVNPSALWPLRERRAKELAGQAQTTLTPEGEARLRRRQADKRQPEPRESTTQAPVASPETKGDMAPPFQRARADERPRSIDASPVVRSESVSRDDAFLMRWLADDLEAISFQQGGSTQASRRAAYAHAEAEDESGKRGMVFNPRVAGTPTQAMFKAMGVTLSRAEIAHQIDRYLTGDAKTPGKGAAAAIRLAPVMAEAWDGARFDYTRVSDETLQKAGISRKQLRSPITLPSEEQPADLVERYLPRSEARRTEELQSAQARELAQRETALNTLAEGDERAGTGTFSDADIDFSPDEIEADTETDEQIRATTLAEVEADPDAQVDRYLTAFGPVLNADNASELFEAYRRSPVTRATRVRAVRPAASAVVEATFNRLIAEPVQAGRLPLAVFTSGGNASGKSTQIQEVPDAHLVFDSTLSQFAPSAAKIDRALDAGLDVAIFHVSRDAEDAWRSVLERAAGAGEGRMVTLAGHLSTHAGAQRTLAQLIDRYKDDPRVTFRIAENVRDTGYVPRSLAWFREREYPNVDALRPRLRAALEEARARGDISDAVYQGAQGVSGTSGSGVSGGPGDRAQAVEGRASEASVRPQKPSQRGGSGGGADASIGDYANLPAKTGSVPLRPGGLFTPPPTTPTVTATKAIEFPEMVGLARELVRTPEVVKRFRNDATRGTFREGAIRLHADLFKQGQEGQLAATLAHEIGHLVDWLPDQSLKRGNLLGRLKSLQGFLKRTFTAADGTRIENAQVKKELQTLSDAWRPWDRQKASPGFTAYRQSARELYADAISVLLNNPGMLEAEAPTFYRQFFEALDNKPDVRRAYFDLQELLSGTRDELIARRRAGVQGMFVEGDTKAIDLERLRQAEKAASRKNFWTRFRIQMVDKNTPFNDRVKEAEKATGAPLPEDEDPRYFLEERAYMGAKLKAFTEEHFQPVYESLMDAGVSWHEFGEALFYARIAAGDRSDLANPRGIAPAAAKELLDNLRRALTPDQRKVLTSATTTFRAAIKLTAERAFDAGLYKPEMYEEMKKNPAYVTFRVIDYLEKNVTSKVYQQVGTLKDVTNPADATILKTLVTLRAIEQQKMKVAAFAFLEKHFPADIEQAQHAFTGRGMAPIEPADPTKQVLVRYYEKGALRGKYVDPHIADSLNNESVGSNWAVVEALRWVNGYLRPIYTGLNLGFQSFNAARDFFRFWKNFPQMTLARAAKRYIESVPMARVRGFGLPKTPSARMQQAASDLREAEHAKILGITFNDVISGRQVEDTQIEDTLAKVGIGAYASQEDKKGVRATLGKVLTWIKNTGDFIETLPKAAAIIEFKGRGRISDISPAQRSFIRRKVGSPDYLSGGTFKPITNEVLLFSNAITQAWRADLEVMRDPKTRAGYWWKTTAVNIAPKLALFAALYLVPDDDDPDGYWAKVRRALEGITEYDLTNYLPVPIGIDAAGNTIYVRLPQDDSGRLMGGLTWKMLQALRGNREAMRSAMQVLDYTAGQLPSISPILDVPIDVVSVASGRNVYDSFRGRFLFTEDELKAADSRTLKKFLGYEFQQLGGGIVWKFYPGEMVPREKTTGQKILEFPVLSNVIGRWVRITNFGKTERMREAQSAVQRDEARIRLDERAAVNEALREYKQLIPPQQTPAEQVRMAREIVSRLYGDADAKKRNTEYRDVLRKIRMGALRGKADPLVDAVMGSTSTGQRVAVLMDARKRTPPPVFAEWMQRAQREGVISAAVVDAYRRELQRK